MDENKDENMDENMDENKKTRIPPAAWIAFVLFDVIIAAVLVWWFVFRDQ